MQSRIQGALEQLLEPQVLLHDRSTLLYIQDSERTEWDNESIAKIMSFLGIDEFCRVD